MFYFILVLLIIDALILATVILLQAGQGGGLASLGGSGSTDTVLGGRQAVTLLTRMSWWCGGIFMALALVLSVISANRGTAAGRSSLQERLRQNAAPAAPAPLPANLPLQSSPPGTDAAPPATDAAPAAAAPGDSAR
jgi:preprotein translocase subunit SecG